MPQHNYPLLNLMLDDMQLADELYCPTNYWQYGGNLVLKDIQEHGIEQFRSLATALHYFVPSYAYSGYDGDPEPCIALRKVIDDLKPNHYKFSVTLEQLVSGQMQALGDYRVYLASDIDKHPYTDKASESSIAGPIEQFTFDGRRFSRPFLNYLLGINLLKKTCDTSGIRTVLEIGGGFGSLGEIFLGDERNNCFYINVDIPPASFVATYYLQQLFGKSNVGDYEALRDEKTLQVNDLREKYRVVVLNSWQLPKLRGQIDLFVNFISFQEMEPNIVQNYLANIDRLSAKFILLRNIREGKEKAKDIGRLGAIEPVKSEDYDRFLPNYRLEAVNTIPFGYKTVDNFHSELKVFVRAW